MDVESTDQHTVKPWFDGKLDFAPPVVDLATQGFPLVGGRLDYIGRRNVAALVYQRQKHFINLFIWPEENSGTRLPEVQTIQGYNVVSWSRKAMDYFAVSDLNSTELGQFANLLSR
jgi:anti-sigma factor RsiW